MMKLSPKFGLKEHYVPESKEGIFFMKITKEQKLEMAREHVDNHVPLYQLYEKYGIGGQHDPINIILA